MNSYIQVICLVVSFLYGIFLYFSNHFNYNILKDKNIVVKIFGNILYILNATLLYILFLYKMNYGILHIYFIFFIVLGYVLMSVKKRKSL